MNEGVDWPLIYSTASRLDWRNLKRAFRRWYRMYLGLPNDGGPKILSGSVTAKRIALAYLSEIQKRRRIGQL